MLSARQELILRLVVDSYLGSAKPVASKEVAEKPEIEWGASTVHHGLGHRNLGSVGVVGPLRMDHATAIASVQGAARELSRYFETIYDG
jgi:transcriptional regulator of heat shock response